jgi:hypothetical protein
MREKGPSWILQTLAGEARLAWHFEHFCLKASFAAAILLKLSSILCPYL